jgi:peroxiredoxin
MPTRSALRAAARALPLALLLGSGCGGLVDDLAPSGKDERPPVVAGSVGPAVGQTAPDFTLLDSLGNPVSLSGTLATKRAVVVYFTMWCNICFDHMSAMRAQAMSQNPDVAFFAIDYVSGSVAGARASEQLYAGEVAGFHVLADEGERWVNFYRAPMGTVVIDRDRVVRWNSDYNPERVPALLGSLP